MLDGQSRRNLLKLMAASFGLAGLTACRRPVENILPASKGVEDYIPGQPYYLRDRDAARRVRDAGCWWRRTTAVRPRSRAIRTIRIAWRRLGVCAGFRAESLRSGPFEVGAARTGGSRASEAVCEVCRRSFREGRTTEGLAVPEPSRSLRPRWPR